MGHVYWATFGNVEPKVLFVIWKSLSRVGGGLVNNVKSLFFNYFILLILKYLLERKYEAR